MDVRTSYAPIPVHAPTRAGGAQSDDGARKKSDDSTVERKEAEGNAHLRHYKKHDHQRLVDITV